MHSEIISKIILAGGLGYRLLTDHQILTGVTEL